MQTDASHLLMVRESDAAMSRRSPERCGVVHEDPDFASFVGVEMALLFPFAPSVAPSVASCVRPPDGPLRDEVEWRNMLSPEQTLSIISNTDGGFEEVVANPWLSSPSGYSSLHDSESDNHCDNFFEQPTVPSVKSSTQYDGVEAIYRFLEECDEMRR